MHTYLKSQSTDVVSSNLDQGEAYNKATLCDKVCQ